MYWLLPLSSTITLQLVGVLFNVTPAALYSSSGGPIRFGFSSSNPLL